MPDPWLAMLLVAATYLAMFGFGEAARLWGRATAAQTRRFGHVAAGGIALTLPLLFATPEPVIALAGTFVAFLEITRRARWLGSIHAIERRSSGAFLYPVAVATAFVLAAGDHPRYAVAVLALGAGDAVGGVVGARWGAHPYSAWGQRKTWEGSIAVLATVVIVASLILLLGGRPPAEAAVTGAFVGVVVTLIEGALPWGLDNLAIPIAAILALDAAGSTWAAGRLLLAASVLFAVALAVPRRSRPAEAQPGEPEFASRGG